MPSILLTDSVLVSAGEALDRGSENSGGTSQVYLVCFVDLVDLVHPFSFVQPNKQDKPNKPQNSLLPLASWFSLPLTSSP